MLLVTVCDQCVAHSQLHLLIETDEPDGALSDLLASSHYLDMFNDQRRNAAYHAALSKTIQPDMTVLDIGTGTGLLALLSARVLCQDKSRPTGNVVACEVFPPMADAARRLIQRRGFDEVISVINKRSDDLEIGPEGDLPDKADLIVSEIVDSQLIGEGILPTTRHATEHLLKEDGMMLPVGAKIWIQLVESSYLAQRGALHLQEGLEQFVKELDLDPLFPGWLKPLSDPIEAMSLDFRNPPPGDSQSNLQVKLERPGVVHAVVLWWELQLDLAGEVILSTRPAWIPTPPDVHDIPKQGWREHWKMCYAPTPPGLYGKGDLVGIMFRQYDLDLSITLSPSTKELWSTGQLALHRTPSSPSTPPRRVITWAEQLGLKTNGELWCMGVSLPDYKRTHQPLGMVQGFDMDSCNSMLGAQPGRYTGWRNVEGKEIWQCGRCLMAMTERKAFKKPIQDGHFVGGKLEHHLSLRVIEPDDLGKQCDAIIFWIRTDHEEGAGCCEAEDPLLPSMKQAGLLLLERSLQPGQLVRVFAKLLVQQQRLDAQALVSTIEEHRTSCHAHESIDL